MQKEINVLALFAGYTECKVFNKIDGRLYDQIVNIDFLNKQLYLYRNADKASWHPLASCLLLLKSLSTISDKDCLTIAPILNLHDANDTYNIFCVKQMIIEKPEEYIATKEGFSKYNEVRDMLKLLGYDCGYLNVPSLIDDGRFAVDINTLNKYRESYIMKNSIL